MLEHNHLLEKKYEFFYNNALVINYSVIDMDKALTVLLKMKGNIDAKNITFYDIFTYINLALCYYKKKNYDDAIKQLITMKTLDVFKNGDIHLRLKIDVAEQIIRYELSDFEIIEYRMNQMKREFKTLLTTKEAKRENEMIKLILLMSKSPNYATQKKIKDLAQSICKIDTDIEEFIEYNEWIQQKFKF
jgi:hypothetical protein